MTGCKKSLIGIFTFALMLSCSIFFLVETTMGAKLILHSVMRSMPAIHIQKIDGTLNNLTLTRLSYTTPSIKVCIKKVHLALRLSYFIKSKLYVNELMLHNVDICINQRQLFKINNPLINARKNKILVTTYPIILKHISLHNCHFQTENSIISLTSFIGGLNWEKNDVTVTPSCIQGLIIALPKITINSSKKNVQKQNDHIGKIAIHAYSVYEKLQTLCAHTIMPALSALDLSITVHIMQLLCEKVYYIGNGELLMHRMFITGYIRNKKLQIDHLLIDSPQGILNATGHITLSGSFPLKFIIHNIIHQSLLKNETITINVSGDVCNTLQWKIQLSGQIEALINLQSNLSVIGLPFSMQFYSSQLLWPFQGLVKYQAKDIHCIVSGKMNNYTLLLTAELNKPHMPPTNLTVNGTGDLEKCAIRKLRLTTLQDSAELQGKVNWCNGINWYGKVTLSGIDISHFYAKLPSKINGKIIARGSLSHSIQSIQKNREHPLKLQNLEIQLDLKGQMLHHPFRVCGSILSNTPHQWHIPGVNIGVGSNKIILKGFLTHRAHLDININAQDLNNIHPTLFGRAQGIIHIRGDRIQPILMTKFSAHHLRWKNIFVNCINLDGSLVASNKMQSHMNLQIEQLKQKTVILELLQLQATGTALKHNLNIQIQSTPISGHFAIHSALNFLNNQWMGTIERACLSTPLGMWTLSKNTAIHYLYKQKILTIGMQRWKNHNVMVSIPQVRQMTLNGKANIICNHLNLMMFNMLMPKTTQLSGILEKAEMHVRWNLHTFLSYGTVALTGKNITIYHNVDGEKIPITISKIQLNIVLHEKYIQIKSIVDLASYGILDANLHISHLHRQRTLLGTINIHSLSVGIFNPILIPGENISGVLNTHLRLSGNLKQPQIFGTMHLNNTYFESNLIPIKLTNSQVTINFNGLRSTLKGIIHSAKGKITLNGEAAWSQINHWYTRIAVIGDRIQVIMPPNIKMDIAPNLLLTVEPKLLTLIGHINIPWAHFIAEQVLLSSVQVSSDEVLLDENLKPLKQKFFTLPMSSNLTLHIGSNVTLDAIGLTGKLHGDLQFKQDNSNIGLYGKIHILSGSLHAYSQDLIIRKGELQFSRFLHQPYLNIEAIRNPESTTDDVTVGVRITGLANKPTCEVFSDPEQTQEEALSYLLHGQKRDSAGSESDTLTSALIGWGVSQSSTLVNKIGQTFNVNHLILDSIGAGEKQQVRMSINVLPRLQIKYSMGIFDSLDTLTLRYRLLPKLYLEAISGMNQAVDFLYRFEF
ncbi:Translocation and assembly module subunit TamB [Candidatus Erwinia haradaeae]|uniref:Translocation and assembly module subunit TamB n=1 Tax=Candidatus Erwinia haradaeae TaxID=1922217 RepID=A0A451DCI2_9GAMM|nr:translocation/assembly module TamB domain-containing protein [Candidatus Erwinia haradaeae]VFP84133.1 Translocation and assembly module subunit TamB [Candidatus Erwinia haradaeae]